MRSNACGTDEIDLRMLNFVFPYCTCALTRIIHCCLTNSVFSRQWKKCLITPLPKSGQVDRFEDFKPISVLPLLSKILEKKV